MERSNKFLRIGLIGTAQIADDWLLPALSQVEGACFWSVLSRTNERGQAFADKHKALAPQAVHTDIGAFLADPQLDAVIIASPDRLHAQQAMQTAAAGKHLFVEKPMTTSVADAKALVGACRERSLSLAVGYHLRWHQGHREVKRLISEGSLGKVLEMAVQWTYAPSPGDWRADSSTGRWWSLAAVGTHCIDLCLWLMAGCGSVHRIESELTPATGNSGHDESARLKLHFDSGATAKVYSSVKERGPRLVEIHCEQGSIVCNGTLGPRGAGEIIVCDKALQFPTVNPYVGELNDFVRSVFDGKQAESNGENGQLNVELLELCK